MRENATNVTDEPPTTGWGRAPEDAAEREQEEPDLVGRLSQRAAQAAAKLAAEKGENERNEKNSHRTDKSAVFAKF